MIVSGGQGTDYEEFKSQCKGKAFGLQTTVYIRAIFFPFLLLMDHPFPTPIGPKLYEYTFSSCEVYLLLGVASVLVCAVCFISVLVMQ